MQELFRLLDLETTEGAAPGTRPRPTLEPSAADYLADVALAWRAAEFRRMARPQDEMKRRRCLAVRYATHS